MNSPKRNKKLERNKETALSGRYLAYPEYKDSGVEWLRNIPQHWNAIKLKYVVKLAGEKSLDPNTKYVGMENVVSGNGKYLAKDDVRPEGITTSFIKGDVLFGKLRPYLAKSWLANFSGICSSEFLVLRSELVHPKFLNYFTLTDEFIGQVNSSTYGSKMPRASWDFISLLEVPISSFSHSEKIANFLDYETAKIDTLIDKQQQLIKLLKEKRQAVISHAVTKGLNPDAAMKDSGVEWLGQVPEHWVVNKFGYISQVVRGGSPRPAGDPMLFNGDYSPWVTVAEITKDDEVYLTKTETFLTKKGSEQCRVFPSGTLLLSNSGATLGVPAILKIDANANDGVVGFENLQLNSEFSYFYLSTLTEDLRERIKQGSGQPNLNTDIVKDISVPIPPKQEVEQIVESIKQLRADYSKLIEKATLAIKLMQERRTALISAAVTGKIDVRHFSLEDGNVSASQETAMETST
jgi:type I restriction enzyme S subunit